MGKMDVSRIDDLYTNTLIALKAGTAAARAAISGLISSFLAGLDGGLVGAVVSWAIGKVIDSFVDLEAKALSIALRCEYVNRQGKVNYENAKKAWNLTNKCSRCKCIGHNKQNHSDDIDYFLQSNRLMGYVEDAEGLVGATHEDGWWDWLIG
jgi:hypothetical protein